MRPSFQQNLRSPREPVALRFRRGALRSVTVPTAGQAVFSLADECQAAAAVPWVRDQS